MTTLIYGHRGANREAAENTRTAFDRALAYPLDGMETDIQLTSDGVAVLWHDGYLGKLGMPAARIDDFTLAELQAMDFAAHFGRGGKPEGILTLREFVESYRAHWRLLLEIKSRDPETPARLQARIGQTLELARAAGPGRALVSSFHLESLVYAHEAAPGFPLVFNGDSRLKVKQAEKLLHDQPYLHGLCLHKKTLTPEMVNLLRGQGKAIAVYTCNSDEEVGHALESGVDILITDLPQQALRLRDA